MITVQTKISVDKLKGKEITEYLLECSDAKYKKWWPGVHLEFHPVRQRQGHIGDIMYMDEFIGRYRRRIKGMVIAATPGEKIVWQVIAGIKMPVVLSLELNDDTDGVDIIHTIKAGYSGVGRVLDPLFRLFLSRGFEKAMDEHVKTEFSKMRDLLH